jgi:hypothetical protein
MNGPFSPNYISSSNDYEYDGDTGDVINSPLFPDESSSIAEHANSDATDDGGYTTITNMIAEGIRSKSTFEVVEVDTLSYGISNNSNPSLVNEGGSSGQVTLSFPHGTVVDHPYDEYRGVKARYSNSFGREEIVPPTNNQQDPPIGCDQSTALSSLTNNESFFMRWLHPKECGEMMLFDPFRDAMRPPISTGNQSHGLRRETLGWNRLIVTSLSSIFRSRPPHQNPEFHLQNPQSPALPLSTLCPPQDLVITTTHSHMTPSVCSSSSVINNVTSLQGVVPSDGQQPSTTLTNHDGAAVMRSYKQYNSTSSDEDLNHEKRKRRRMLLLTSFLTLLIVGIVSIAIVASRDSETSEEEYTTNSADKHHQDSDGALPNACCIDGMNDLDEWSGEVEVALPALFNETDDFSTLTPALEVEDAASVSLASSQNNEPPSSQPPPTPFTSEIASPHGSSVTEAIPTLENDKIPNPVSLLNSEDVTEDIFSAKLGSRTETPSSFVTASPTFRVDAPSSSILLPDHTDHPIQPSYRPTTKQPAKELSKKPSKRPTRRPRTRKPSEKPTSRPTPKPVIREVPSVPVISTDVPTDNPSLSPVHFPTFMPSTAEPSSSEPTKRPTVHPVTSHPTTSTPSINPAAVSISNCMFYIL